ncbi:putative peptidoglycan binding domain protein [compost metagenome]
MQTHVTGITEKIGNTVNSNQQKNKPFFAPVIVQPKLTIGPVDDPYEREADSVAEKVMRTPEKDVLQAKPSPIVIQKKCAACEEEELNRKEDEAPAVADELSAIKDIPVQRKCAHCEEEERNLQMKGADGAKGGLGALSIVNQVINSQGEPLHAATRSFMESRFGYDFSNVQIHNDLLAHQSSTAINAKAYTHANHVVFGSGQFQPDTNAGKQLLAHELTHVVQQRAGQQQAVQRRIGDGHDLNAARFKGNIVLEALYDNEQLLRKGDKGPAVKILQQALIDSGMTLPVYGVDGKFGAETENAVKTFQRASGLSGIDRDGVVGPTTMGWLDQRFTNSPTPAGTSRGATTGCPAFKTIKVDFVSFRGSTRNPGADLDYANTVFNQCCVKFEMGKGFSLSNAESDIILKGNTELNVANSCAALSAEESSLVAKLSPRVSSRFKVFYVDTISTGDRAMSFPPYCATGLAASRLNFSFVSNSAMPRSLAHEFGHILLNSPGHAPGVTTKLMHPTNAATAEDLDATDCATVFANA